MALLLIFLLTLLLFSPLTIQAEALLHSPGICYGTLSDSLPSPYKVAKMFLSNNITRVRIYNPDPSILSSLSNTSIDLTIGVPNQDIPKMAADPAHAHLWLANNISPFAHSLHIRRITVGNEYVNPRSATAPKDVKSMHDAILNMHNAVASMGFHNPPEVSTVIQMDLLASSFPPSNGTFREEISQGMGDIVKLLRKSNTSLLVNIYPYFAYVEDTDNIALSYALFMGRKTKVKDGNSTYTNLFDAMVGAVGAALRRVDGGGVGVVVGETGWPTKGNRAATVENARTYNENMGRHVGGGEVYIFAMFDEDEKKKGVERRWGVFNPDMSPKYKLRFYQGTTRGGNVGGGPVAPARAHVPVPAPLRLHSSLSVRVITSSSPFSFLLHLAVTFFFSSLFLL